MVNDEMDCLYPRNYFFILLEYKLQYLRQDLKRYLNV